MAVFAGAVFIGSALGPILGSFITESYLGRRWTAWTTMIISGVWTGLGMLWVPETSVPIILQKRAARKVLETKE